MQSKYNRRCEKGLTIIRPAKLAGLFLLACSLSVEAVDIENIYIEIDDIRERLTERLTTQVEERVRSQVRARVKHSVEDRINDVVMETIAGQVGSTIATPLPRRDKAVTEYISPLQARARIFDQVDITEPAVDVDRLIDSQLNRVRNQIDLILNTVQDHAGNSALTNEWLIMTDDVTLSRMIGEGYLIKNIEELTGLGYVLGTVQAPGSFSPKNIAAVQVVYDPLIVVDLNHVYLPQRRPDESLSGTAASTPQRPLPVHDDNTAWSRIGMIDSSINTSHSVFAASHINEQAFTPRKGDKSLQHGTAIASILVGQSNQFRGLSPRSHLYNGVVFATDELGREFSTTAAIVRAINWLATSDVKLINMSLAGPDNAILRQAINSACARGIVIVTAAGNAGPASNPLFPAGYDCTIAVTAVDDNGKPYHRANRGDHIDYALPGIDVRHASDGDSFDDSSGTSFAAAQLTGLIATELAQTALSFEEVKARLNHLATDIGRTGRDPVFGQGLIRSTARASISD